jgi:hypothetical protein
MTSNIKYIGMDVHKESISACVRNSVGKVVMECVIETKASMILQFIDGLRGELQVTSFIELESCRGRRRIAPLVRNATQDSGSTTA